MPNTTSSITDIPRNSKSGDKDNFGISPYEKGLVQFIANANTPVTVALQGEWGSGKTSLMNSLQETLADDENPNVPYHGVWLNTWEYALMKDAPDTLMSIITGLIKEISSIAKADPTTTQKMVKKLWGVGKDTMKFAAKKAADQVVSGSSALIDNMLADTSSQSSISEVRNELEVMIENTIKRDGKRGVIFFIDDLDRIDPPIAVQLLELLKNIFTINNCVFVLAIDYDVVIKGLEPKFGKFTAKNEREFRSFFDKIIQVPFSMPVGSYSVNTFLKESLATINYLPESKCNDADFIDALSKIAEMTVGTNPRALKRLLNSLSLINSINLSKGGDEGNAMKDDLSLVVNFALVSTQIAYPMIYRLLNNYPAFDEWDERIALQMSLPELDAQAKEKLAQSEAFDEEWEQVVFRICESDYYLKKRALYISNLLNLLRDTINKKQQSIEDTIEAVITLSSVTNLEAFDKPPSEYNQNYWQEKISEKAYAVVNGMLDIVNQCSSEPFTLHFTKKNITFTRAGKLFRTMTFEPKQKFTHILYTGISDWANADDWEKRLMEAGLKAQAFPKYNLLKVTIATGEELATQREVVADITELAVRFYENQQ